MMASTATRHLHRTSRDEPRPPSGAGRRALVALVLLVGVVVGAASAASAHAGLSSSNPAGGSVVAEAPKEVVLTFTEAVSVQPDGIRVLDAEGRRVDAGLATADGAVVTSPIEGELARGGYAVSWRVTSADGHPVQGTFTFSVGEAAEVGDDVAAGAFAGSHDGRDKAVAGVLRAVLYLAVLGVGGAALVGRALHRDGDPPVLGRVAGVLAGLGALAALGQLPIQASLATGRGWSSVTEPDVLRSVLGDGIGLATALAVAGLAALAITVGLEATRPVQATAAAGAALALVSLPVTGHTRTMSPLVVGMAADLVHVVAGAVWFGGLLALVRVLRRRRAAGDVDAAAEAVTRFSALAAVTVALLAVAGTVMGWLEVGGVDGLLRTSYGRYLLAKVAVVALVLVGAWWNRSRFVPTLAAAGAPATVDHDVAVDVDGDLVPDAAAGAVPGGDGSPAARADWRRFDRVLRIEVVGIVVALALTAVLVNLTPGKTRSGGPEIVTTSTELGTGRLELSLEPAGGRTYVVHLYLYDGTGKVDGRYEDVTVQLAQPSRDVAPLDAPVVKVGPGHFQVVQVDIPFAGDWTVDVAARLDRFTEVTAEAEVTLD